MFKQDIANILSTLCKRKGVEIIEAEIMPDHVGIVEKCEEGLVYTIEGNVNDDCAQGHYYVGDTCIFGYGLPAY